MIQNINLDKLTLMSKIRCSANFEDLKLNEETVNANDKYKG